jgi:ribosomal-protein-serine acetyltransferase
MERATARPSALNPIDAGEDVLLHPVSIADTAELYRLVDRNRLHLRKWLPWAGLTYNYGDLQRHLEERELENTALQALTLHIRVSGVLCGSVGLHRIDPRHHNSSIGYWIDADHQGRGIMTRACRALIGESFRGYGLHRIEIRCGTGNERSAAIPRRLGFTEEGLLREAEWVHDRWVDLRLFSMLRQDWH